ncbi:MAG: DUF2207 domain-containing protein [Synergistaceae bacterium]|nr:DUF2207 domain-containing protein [Synergistaceae bacterium]
MRSRKQFWQKKFGAYLLIFFLTFFLIFFAVAAPASARVETPVIESLDVRATVTKDGILSVEETLAVLFDGPLSMDLTRGISGHYSQNGPQKIKTGFVLLDATLDERPTKINIRRNPDSLRLTLAAKGDPFSPGRHVFKLKYELINMVIFRTDNAPQQDLLTWSLVRESSYPILRISVEVKLPGEGDVEPGNISARDAPKGFSPSPFRIFTGRLEDVREGEGVRVERPGLISTTTRLPEGKAFTLYMSWDKGLVSQNDRSVSPWRYWDLCVMTLLTVYYVFIWSAYGRSPKRQTPTLSLEPPENLSPGLLRCIRDAGPSARALAAEILNLAVKGYVHLYNFTASEPPREKNKEKPGKKAHADTKTRYSLLERMMGRKYRLHLNLPVEEFLSLSVTENILLHNLFAQHGETDVILDETCSARLRAAFRALSRNFSELGRRFFFQHMKRWVLGLVFFEGYTAFVMFQTLSRGVGGIEPGSEHALAFMAPLFFLTPLLGGETIWKQSTPMFILRTGIPLFFCACSLAILRQQGMDPLSIASLVGGIAVIGFFWKIAPVRSEEGQRLLDQIEGFQMGLGSRAELKEQDDIEKFEALLPYAYALDLEQTLIARYAPLISRLRHHAKWHTAETRGFSSGSEHYTLSYELGEAIKTILRN